MKNRKLHLWILAASGVMTLISLMLHFSGLSDRMTSFERLGQIVEFHDTDVIFSQRPVTTYLIQTLSEYSSLSIGKAFVLINFGFLFLSGYLVGVVSSFFNKSNVACAINVILFFLTFSNFFVFFSPVYTYDEPIQYAFILLSMIALIKNRLVWFTLLFGMAMITKETSIILLPGFYMLYVYFHKESEYSKEKLRWAFLAPIIIYGIYLGFSCTFESNLKVNKRLKLIKYNFKNWQFAIESIVSFVLVAALSLYLYLRIHISKRGAVVNVMRKAFITTLLINSMLVFGMAYAREARLFALPLFFAWPIFSRLLLHHSFEWRINLSFKTLLLAAITVGIGVLSYYGIMELYDPVIGSGAEGWFHFYFAVLCTVIAFDALFKRVKS